MLYQYLMFLQLHGEVLYILGELKKDGYDSAKATPDQTITYLWKRYNRAKMDREEANNALKEKIGGDQYRLLQVSVSRVHDADTTRRGKCVFVCDDARGEPDPLPL